MKDIKALLDLKNDFFDLIKGLIREGFFDEAYHAIKNEKQPAEWIETGRSEADNSEYQYNDIQLIEGVMYRLFSNDWGYTVTSVYHIQDKGRFSSTSVVDGFYKFSGETEYHRQGGAASSFCPDIRLLNINTAKVVSQGKKNFCKQLGKLLGLDLNREQEELPIISTKQEPSELDKETDQQLAQLRMQLKLASTKEAAEKLLSSSPFKFSPELKEIVNQKVN